MDYFRRHVENEDVTPNASNAEWTIDDVPFVPEPEVKEKTPEVKAKTSKVKATAPEVKEKPEPKPKKYHYSMDALLAMTIPELFALGTELKAVPHEETLKQAIVTVLGSRGIYNPEPLF